MKIHQNPRYERPVPQTILVTPSVLSRDDKIGLQLPGLISRAAGTSRSCMVKIVTIRTVGCFDTIVAWQLLY